MILKSNQFFLRKTNIFLKQIVNYIGTRNYKYRSYKPHVTTQIILIKINKFKNPVPNHTRHISCAQHTGHHIGPHRIIAFLSLQSSAGQHWPGVLNDSYKLSFSLVSQLVVNYMLVKICDSLRSPSMQIA